MLPVPKRNEDYFCSECKMPTTISWDNDICTNTCTSDNILTILLLSCKQYPTLLKKLNSSPAENAMKSGLTLMLQGKVNLGKTTILNYMRLLLRLQKEGNKYDCFGTEFAMFLTAFSHIFKVIIKKRCNSSFCPNPSSQSYHSTYSLRPETNGNMTVAEQVADQFPSVGHCKGYCGAEFPGVPPEDAPQAVNNRFIVEINSRVSFIECRGAAIVQNSVFLCKSPWMVPFNIAQYSNNNIMELLCLQRQVTLYGTQYILGGYTLNSSGHFTCVVFWKGKEFFYDGLLPESSRLAPLDTSIHFLNKEGSYAIYLLK